MIAVSCSPTRQSTDLKDWPLGGSPSSITNTSQDNMMVFVSGGTVSLIRIAQDGSTFVTTGLLSGMFLLKPGGAMTIAYIVIPTIVSYVYF